MLERFGDKACYTYNSAGIRTEKCIKNKATKYVVSGSTILSETTNNIATIYYHSADGIIGFNRAGTDYFYRKNLQGDIITIVNASGTVVAKYHYDAWGNHKVYNSAGTVIYDSQNPTSTYANEIGHINPFRYRSYYFDNETGLYYLQSRYYDPQVGRFINADSIDYLEPENIQSLNLYSYCQNNPVMYYDPNGHVILGMVLGFLFGALWGAVSAKASNGNVLVGALIGGIVGIATAGFSVATTALKGAMGFISTLATTFSLGVLGDIAVQRFVGNKKIEDIDEEQAAVAGVINMVSGTMGAYYGNSIKEFFKDEKLSQYVSRTVLDFTLFFAAFVAGLVMNQ